jgi:formylglycine-generating enzyme required for sulfatase activity
VKTLCQVRIFIASPGDLKEERGCIETIADRLNSDPFIENLGIALKTLRWEKTYPQIGRPQDIINKDVQTCNILVGMLHRRFGSPSGKEESGTYEEFKIALDRWEKTGSPQIMFYFKTIRVRSIEEFDDEQLKKVLEFKKEIESARILLFSEFNDSEFEAKFEEDLKKAIIDLCKDRKNEGADIGKRPESIPSAFITDFSSRLKPFLEYHLNANRHLSMQGFESTLRVPIEIERIYVNMRASVGGYKPDSEGLFSQFGKRFFNRTSRSLDCGEPVGFVDIRQAFHALKNLHVKDMIVLGDPGSGKTTLLKYILVMLVEEKGKEKLGLDSKTIPFFLPLRDLQDPSKETFEQFVLRVCKCVDYGIDENLVKKILSSGESIILLDGLDEVADEAMRQAVCKWIDRARRIYASTTFIISSRFAGYLGKVKLEDLPVLELSIQDFTSEEIAAFLTRWHETVRMALNPMGNSERIKKDAAEEAKSLFAEIEASGHIRKFAVNPLLLQIIALVRYDRGKEARLPERRVELYQECTDVLLAKWDMARGLKVMITAQQAREILQPIALWLHEKDGRRSAPRKDLEKDIRKSLNRIGRSDITPDALLRNIRDRSGIFMGYGTEEYGFTHLSFQEYLAAEQVRNQRKIELLANQYDNKWWREVALLALSLSNPSIIEEYMGMVINKGKLRGDLSIITDSVRDSIIKPVEAFAGTISRTDLTQEECQNAILVLESIGGEQAIGILREAAKSEEKPIARSAYSALVRLHAESGVAAVAEDKPVRMRGEKDGSELALVSAGTFLYGSRMDDKNAYSQEKPQQSLYLPDFYIGVYPVTNEQYKKFIDATGRRPPDKADYSSGGGPVWKGNSYPKDKAKHPVVCVNWDDACAYARWAGGRLPSEVEWEKAARGVDGRIYPWGNDWDKSKCNSGESQIRGTTPVDAYQGGIGPYGCFDMAGNVWEWCFDWFSENNQRDPEQPAKSPEKGSRRVLRGGSWFSLPGRCRCAFRIGDVPGNRLGRVGFRVVFVPQFAAAHSDLPMSKRSEPADRS